MNQFMTATRLRDENRIFADTGGVSAGNHEAGFIPAFCDTATGRVEPSRMADGRLAPMHLLAGLPEDWIVERDPDNRVLAVKSTVIAGFLRDGAFYTRAAAAHALH